MPNRRVIATSFMYRDIKDYENQTNIMVGEGITALRVNCTRFSNIDYLWQINRYREAFSKHSIRPEIILDIPFPGDKERVFFNVEKRYPVEKDKIYYIHSGISRKDSDLWIKSETFFAGLNNNDYLIVGDGEVEFVVLKTDRNSYAEMMAVNSGTFSLGKSLTNVSNYKTKNCPEDRQKQLIDLIDMIRPDGVMLSFCESVEDIHYIQSLFPWIKIIPKVETMKGADSVSAFYECVDEICLGRGDLGIINQYDCARVQDEILHIAHEQQKRIIIGTGILQSLSQGKVIPSRAELTDLHDIKKFKEASIMIAAGIATNELYLKRAMKIIRGIV